MSKQNELSPGKYESLSKSEILQKYQYAYDLIRSKLDKLLEENYMNEDFQNQIFLPKEFKHLK